MGFERKETVRPSPKAPAPQVAAPQPLSPAPTPAPSPAPTDEKPLFPERTPPGKRITPPKPRLAIVIDDMGPDIRKLREIISIGEPVTIAMTPKEISAKMEEGLKTVPDAIGLNNHMGSKFTESIEAMRTVLKLVKKKEMLFLDSRTSSDTVGRKVARELKVRNAERNVFLDNTRDVQYIKNQLVKAARIAKKRGKAVAIGHPYPETIKALAEALPELDGVELVPISEIAE